MRSPTLSARFTRRPIGGFRWSVAKLRPACSARTFDSSSRSLPLYCSPNRPSMTRGIHLHQHRQRAQHHDVLEQRALARVFVGGVADRGDRHADDVDVVTKCARRQRPGAVVEQIAAGLDLEQIVVPGLRVHRHHHVDAAAPAEPALLADANLIPGGQALDVAGEDVARAHRHAHAQDGLGEQLVGRGRTRTVDVGELDDEVVDGFDALHGGPPFALRAAPATGSAVSRRRGDGFIPWPPCAAARACCPGTLVRTWWSAAGTSACPRRRSDSARHTGRSAGIRLRP